MKSLYLRIWLTVVAALALFALGAGWLLQRHVDEQRQRYDRVWAERLDSVSELATQSLPAADAPRDVQATALNEWSRRLRIPMVLTDAAGQRIAASDSQLRREVDAAASAPAQRRLMPLKLADGRTLWVARAAARRLDDAAGKGADAVGGIRAERPAPPPLHDPPLQTLRNWSAAGPPELVLAALLVVLFVAVAAGAYPVVRRLTRRLEALKQGVDTFGAGALGHRVPADGHDEVAALGTSFNTAAARIEALVRAHRDLLANASHELRSPLARLKIAVELLRGADAERRDALKAEVDRDIAELDALIDEVLLASRLEAGTPVALDERVDLLALARAEGAHVGAIVTGAPTVVRGNERLLRRALRNLLENARRYGDGEVRAEVYCDVGSAGDGGADIAAGAGVPIDGSVGVRVCDNGPGVPADERERIFEPFYRMPGHAEHAGGVGLGLALVRQIARRHDGDAVCVDTESGGCFALMLPAGRALSPDIA